LPTGVLSDSRSDKIKEKENRMKNVEMSVKGEILTVTINLSKDFGRSKSGKTVVVASTDGFVSVPGKDGVKINLNVNK